MEPANFSFLAPECFYCHDNQVLTPVKVEWEKIMFCNQLMCFQNDTKESFFHLVNGAYSVHNF